MTNYPRRTFIKKAALLSAIPWDGLLGGPRRPAPGRMEPESELHRIMTCNIRVDLPEDGEKGFGWQSRKAICAGIIAAHQPDIICLQEVLKGQIEDLKDSFPAFSAFGFEGPEMDAHPTGYHGIAKNPILFSNERYELVGGGCYWLSETPLIGGSISWNSARARHANYVRLRDKNTKREFRVVNLHLDHLNQEAREKQIGVVLKESQQYMADFPQLLTGDFNAGMANPVYRLVKAQGWTDSYTALHGDNEPGYTVHQFKGDRYEKKDRGKKIDFVFSKGVVKPVAAEIIRDHVAGKYPSDHYFVSATVRL